MRVALVSVMLLCAVGACDKKKSAEPAGAPPALTATSLLDKSLFETALKPRVSALFERPSISAAFDGFFASVTADPKVRDGFGVFLAQLEADPKIVQGTGAVLERVQNTEEMRNAVMTLMAQNPSATPDQIGDMVGKQFEQTWESPPVAAAWSASFNQLTRRLDTAGVLGPLEHTFSARIDPYLSDPKKTAHWDKRLTELNGGTAPSAARAMQLYIDTAWSNERMEMLVTKLLGNPTLRREAAATVARLLQSESLRTEVKADCAAIMSDKGFQDAAVEVMRLLSGPNPDPAPVRVALTKLLTSKPLVDSAGRLIHMMVEDPQLTAIFAEWLDHVSKDTQLAADFDAFFDGW